MKAALSGKSASMVTAGVLTVPVALGLFYLMATLVSQPAKLENKYGDENFIDFVRSVPRSNNEIRKRSLPKKPPTPKPQPKMPKMAVKSSQKASNNMVKSALPMLNSPLALGDGPYLGGGVGGGGAGTGDSSEMPLVRIEPQYPRKAAMAGKEGWVQLKFDVTETGSVDNVSVIKSKPRRLFDQSAKRALLKWKYKPKVVDGKPQRRSGLMVQLDFKLNR
jgi:protein TonB